MGDAELTAPKQGMPGSGREIIPSIGTLGVSPQEADLIRRRAEYRNALKLEYRKQQMHPYRTERGPIFDPQYYRFQAYRAWPYEYGHATVGGMAKYFIAVVAPILLFSYHITTHMNKIDADVRYGQVPYEKRTRIIPNGWWISYR